MARWPWKKESWSRITVTLADGRKVEVASYTISVPYGHLQARTRKGELYRWSPGAWIEVYSEPRGRSN